jgi:hydrogenase maturation protease
LVVGLGSPERGDDAVGPVVAQRFAGLRVPGIRVVERADPTTLVELWDGGGGRAELAIVVDAVRSNQPPGSLTVLETGSQCPAIPDDSWATTGRGGARAFGVAASVELARTLHRLPRRVVLIGVEAASFERGAPLSAPVAEAVGPAIDAMIGLLWANGEVGPGPGGRHARPPSRSTLSLLSTVRASEAVS